MAEPVEFSSFYKLIQSVKEGKEEQINQLQWMLAEYEHANQSKNAYDELGQIFCHHGVMELYEYTGIENIQIISSLDKLVWDYLKLRTQSSLSDYMIKSMVDHAKQHNLSKKVAEKWEMSTDEIDANMEDLAKYVVEGIVDILSSPKS